MRKSATKPAHEKTSSIRSSGQLVTDGMRIRSAARRRTSAVRSSTSSIRSSARRRPPSPAVGPVARHRAQPRHQRRQLRPLALQLVEAPAIDWTSRPTATVVSRTTPHHAGGHHHRAGRRPSGLAADLVEDPAPDLRSPGWRRRRPSPAAARGARRHPAPRPTARPRPAAPPRYSRVVSERPLWGCSSSASSPVEAASSLRRARAISAAS